MFLFLMKSEMTLTVSQTALYRNATHYLLHNNSSPYSNNTQKLHVQFAYTIFDVSPVDLELVGRAFVANGEEECVLVL